MVASPGQLMPGNAAEIGDDYGLISEAGDQFVLYADMGSLGGQLQVYTGGRALIVGTMSVAGQSNQALAMSLADKARPRIP